ncbi:MAG: hypothetical protein B6I20_07810 [Bacteroidetes bacterium 4572_117]|nr:MAG: hypothetical protein B6I20_07810 [Bacteroidetes bacterium 4572_117]
MLIDNNIFKMLACLISAFIIVWISIPSIVRVAKAKHLFDEPEERSSHKTNTPILGGLAIFAGFTLSANLWIDSEQFRGFQYIMAATVVLFFIGVKDDILVTAPLTKLAGQLIAALIIVLLGDLRLTSLHGFFGINEINYYWSIVITILTIIVIINGFNFIDGVDGLSASIGIITTGAFGYWFFLINEFQYVILAISLAGSLLAFFIYNVFGDRNKIFMGDTGSLIIGLLLSVMVIHFNEVNIDKSLAYAIYPAPAVSFGVLIIPLFDTIRVMFIRLFTGKPLYGADKNHLHHQLLELGLNHRQVTMIMSIGNVLFIYMVFSLSFISIRRLLLIILIAALLLSYVPPFLLYLKKKKTGK